MWEYPNCNAEIAEDAERLRLQSAFQLSPRCASNNSCRLGGGSVDYFGVFVGAFLHGFLRCCNGRKTCKDRNPMLFPRVEILAREPIHEDSADNPQRTEPA